jgi:hypothetical protein
MNTNLIIDTKNGEILEISGGSVRHWWGSGASCYYDTYNAASLAELTAPGGIGFVPAERPVGSRFD